MSTFKKTFAAFITVIFVATSVYTPILNRDVVPQAEAITTIEKGPQLVLDKVNTALSKLSEFAETNIWLKEYFLDPALYAIAKMVLKQMTSDIIDWINSGFQGSPMFVSDLQGTLLQAANLAVGDFIANDPNLAFLCSPFELDVKLALITSYQETMGTGGGEATAQTSCSLDDVSDNIEGFLGGSFTDGGWQAWFETTQNPERNTPTGAMLEAETEMYIRIIDEQENVVTELDWGDGFFSIKLCGDGSIQGPGDPTKDCDVTTPGQILADQINGALGVPRDSLIAADEINEIIGALFQQLLNQVLGTGLRGLSGGGGDSYTNRMRQEQELSEELAERISEVLEPFAEELDEYSQVANRIITEFEAVEAFAADAEAILPNCSALGTINTLVPTTLLTYYEQAVSGQAEISENRARLTELEAEFEAAATPEARNDVLTEISDMRNELQPILQSRLDLEIYVDGDIEDSLEDDVDAANVRIVNEALACIPSPFSVNLVSEIDNHIDDLQDLRAAAASAGAPSSAIQAIEEEISAFQARRDDLLNNNN